MAIWFAASGSGAPRVRAIFGICMIVVQLTGAALSIWGGIWLLVIAFKEKVSQGLLVLLPPYALYYIISRWEKTKGAFALQLADGCSVLLFSVIGVAVIGASIGAERGAARPAGIARNQFDPQPGPDPGVAPGPPQPALGLAPIRRLQPAPGTQGFVSRDPKAQYQRLVAQYGAKAVLVLFAGLPSNSDPALGVTTRDVSEALNKRVRALAPTATNWMSLTIDNDSGIALAPVDDVQALAASIDFGEVTTLNSVIHIAISKEYIASVPRLPVEPMAAAVAPSHIGPEPEIPADADPVTRSLIQLKSPDIGRRKEAIQRLGRTAPGDRLEEVVAALLPLLDHDDGFLVNDAVKALAVWRSPTAVPALIARTSDDRFFVRKEAIKTLGKYKDARAVEPIADRLKDDGFEAEAALKEIGSIAEPALIDRLKSADSEIRRKACDILKELGGKETLEAMRSMPADPEFGVRVAAQAAMKQIAARVGQLPPRAGSGKGSSSAAGIRKRSNR
jgi:hypothetical protein